MQTPVFAAEVEQWVTAGLKPGADDFADQDHMIAAVMQRVAFALEIGERPGQQRRVIVPPAPGRFREAILT